MNTLKTPVVSGQWPVASQTVASVCLALLLLLTTNHYSLAQVSTNKPLMVNTSNVTLLPSDSNFFAANSNLLNQSVSGGGGGGGAATNAVSTLNGLSNAVVIAVSNVSGSAAGLALSSNSQTLLLTATNNTNVTTPALLTAASNGLVTWADATFATLAGMTTTSNGLLAQIVAATNSIAAGSITGTLPLADLPVGVLTNFNAGNVTLSDNLLVVGAIDADAFFPTVAGTTLAPSYNGPFGSGTGIYFPTTNEVAVSTSNQQSMLVTPAGVSAPAFFGSFVGGGTGNSWTNALFWGNTVTSPLFTWTNALNTNGGTAHVGTNSGALVFRGGGTSTNTLSVESGTNAGRIMDWVDVSSTVSNVIAWLDTNGNFWLNGSFTGLGTGLTGVPYSSITGGTSNYVLTAQGAGTNPVWAAAGGGTAQAGSAILSNLVSQTAQALNGASFTNVNAGNAILSPAAPASATNWVADFSICANSTAWIKVAVTNNINFANSTNLSSVYCQSITYRFFTTNVPSISFIGASSNWNWQGSPAPSQLLSNKVSTLTLQSWGTNETDVSAAFSQQNN